MNSFYRLLSRLSNLLFSSASLGSTTTDGAFNEDTDGGFFMDLFIRRSVERSLRIIVVVYNGSILLFLRLSSIPLMAFKVSIVLCYF